MTATSMVGLTVHVGERRLLDNVDLQLEPGAVTALVGPNGAGKTTLLDALMGDVASHGDITCPPRSRTARLLQGSPLPDTLTVGELLDLVTDGPDGTEELGARFGLTAHFDKRIAGLSTGMRRVLDLAVTTSGDHDLLLLDEPAAGLAHGELAHLAALIRAHAERTGATVLLVEHNRELIELVADRVVMLDGGRIVDGHQGRVGDHESFSPSSNDIDLRPSLAAITAAGVPAPAVVRHELSTWTKLRLGLREFAAGMASVLILGVLNRVMKVELGISLAVVAALLASYNLAAPVALAIGHRSDQRPIRGRHRSPYIVGGALLTAAAVAAAPHLADLLARGLHPIPVGLTVVVFVVMGIGMYGSGTVYFALIADITPRQERAHTASVVYLMLMGGILAGAVLSATILDDAARGRHTLFAIVALLVVALNVAATWGLDPGVMDDNDFAEPTSAWHAVREVVAIGAGRRFFAFSFLASAFLFLQQAVLEPYGGEVLGLSVRATTGFNAVQTLGVLVGMLVTGRGVADRAGHKRTAMVGLVGSALAFAALAAAALVGSVPASWFAILGVGVASGLFSVAVLALMMAMSVPERVALFMGAWTVSHALADGLATAGGGVIQQVAQSLTTTVGAAYAAVFALQSVGLLLCTPLLRRVDVQGFAKEIASASAHRAAARFGWLPEEQLRGDAEEGARAQNTQD